jgi:HK97 family phage portal protein
LGILSRILQPFKAKAAEGEYRPGPYLLSDGWLSASAGTKWNWWQSGHSLAPYGQHSAMVEACISAYAQTIAMCPGDHWRRMENGGRERLGSSRSALARVLKKPNDYQSISDFLLNLSYGLYGDGNAYALALRNDRQEIEELHLMNPRHCSVAVAETGEVFYHLGGNEIVESRLGKSLTVPARDVLHVRLQTPKHPLKGVSPVLAAALDMAANDAVMKQQLTYFMNQSRPSFILHTDEKWDAAQTAEARKAWEQQSQGMNAGKTPIMGWGLKAQQIGGTAVDAQLAETLKMSDQHIALAFRVPQQILGIGGTPFASTEALMQSWVATGLGFALNHIEEAFGRLFRLKGYPEEYLELNTDALLRSNFKERIEALARATQAGIYSPDEARAEEDLGKVPGGHGEEPRMQQQNMPLSWHTQPSAPEPPAPPDEPQEVPDERHSPDDITRRLYEHASQLH